MVSTRTSIQRIERLCEAPLDERTLRERTLAELRRLVGCDAFVWLLTDPVTAVGVSPFADVPVRDLEGNPWTYSELPTTIRLKYLTDVNRWTGLTAAEPVALLRKATGDDPARSSPWRDLLQRYGIGDVASVVLADRFGTWGFLPVADRSGPVHAG